MTNGWFDRLLTSLAERGRTWIRIPTHLPPLEQARELAASLVSEKGEASGAALSGALLERYHAFGPDDRVALLTYFAESFAPDPERLRAAAEAYLAMPTPDTASALAEAAEPPRQELIRRLNMAPDGTATLVAMRETVLHALGSNPALRPLETDLRHLLTSWFNRGFLELRRIDWNTPASVLEKLITYEAVHEIRGWDDLRRRLAPDRRCFAFFHPALADEPLIFVEVALVQGLAGAIEPLLGPVPETSTTPDTAIFYSISNCQRGLRGISFGNFLIKQVVEELMAELPTLRRFATLSPVPGFRRWFDQNAAAQAAKLGKDGEAALARLAEPDWVSDAKAARPLEALLKRACAEYLTDRRDGRGPSDPVAKFHLRNGARLERINWLGNTGPRGLDESYGLMVNYLYDLDRLEANHEAFVRLGQVAQSTEITALLRDESGRNVSNLLNFGSSRRG